MNLNVRGGIISGLVRLVDYLQYFYSRLLNVGENIIKCHGLLFHLIVN